MGHSLPGKKCVTTGVGADTVLFNLVKELNEGGDGMHIY